MRCAKSHKDSFWTWFLSFKWRESKKKLFKNCNKQHWLIYNFGRCWTRTIQTSKNWTKSVVPESKSANKWDSVTKTSVSSLIAKKSPIFTSTSWHQSRTTSKCTISFTTRLRRSSDWTKRSCYKIGQTAVFLRCWSVLSRWIMAPWLTWIRHVLRCSGMRSMRLWTGISRRYFVNRWEGRSGISSTLRSRNRFSSCPIKTRTYSR